MSLPAQTTTHGAMQRQGRMTIRVLRLFCDFELPDSIEMPEGRPLLIAGNHRSLLDVFCALATCASIGASCRLMVQARYFSNPVIGRWLRSLGCIPLNSATKDEAFVEARAALERNELVGIMPEGRLVPPEERSPQTGEFRQGFSELATSANATVRPIVFHHTDTVWPRNKWPRLVRPRPKVTLRFGDDVELDPHNHLVNAERLAAAHTQILNELDADHNR